ncbi:hypothetical protein LHP98_14010 [Rhodobacter sp. Har01]|uniref:hypothetical protein n=1 Tax=Rhodobacter sp. Har01 TaxID=2883999 RepID=UPI001D0931C4|nr:hypothetical protein [Rhodobacter sp. Har01]MCB6179237.1 hypothetical protein [Rhodobacter sp. Har01]
MMSALKPALRVAKSVAPAAVTYHAEERAMLRSVHLRSLSALDQMYAYWGADRV